MANDLTDDPIVLDTAHATNVVVQGQRYVYAIKLVASADAASAILKVKASAKPFWRGGAASNGDTDFDLVQMKTPGDLVLTTCANAVVLVYLGNER